MKHFIHAILGDTDIQHLVGLQLRIGVLLAFGVCFLGGVLLFIQQGSNPAPDFSHFVAPTTDETTLLGIYHGVLSGQPMAFIQLGVVLLIATPILRVFLSLLAFALEGDYLYVVITAIVLTVILLNIYWGV